MSKKASKAKPKISRRKFLLVSAVAGGGALIGYAATRPSRHRVANDTLAGENDRFATSWIRLRPDNRVTVYVPHSEMGQGVHTALAMMVADELDADWELVDVEQAPASELFANDALVRGFSEEMVPGVLLGLVNAASLPVARAMNLQITGGSSSVRYTGQETMRTAGAAAREMLVECAARRWGVAGSECLSEASHVRHAASGRSLAYGELADDVAQLEPPANPVLKDRSRFTIMGKAISRRDIPGKVDGSAPFGSDAHSEDMLYAALRLAPVFGAKLVSVDPGEALAQRGVRKVVELGDGYAVVADNSWRAARALEMVTAEFSATANDSVSSAVLAEQFDAALATDNGSKDFESGDADAALEAADDVLEAGYRVPYLAHAAMEPMSCTVHIQGDRAEVWTSTQDALGTKARIASVAGLPKGNVTFHHTYLGGGFGRRVPSNPNVLDHAALIAKQFDVPVKTMLSREEDTRQDYYRPAVHSNFKAAFDAEGRVTAWHNRFTGPIQVPGASHIPYAIANQSIRMVEVETHVPIAAWRSVDHTQQTFFIESFIDEIAHRRGVNPYQLRMELLQDHPRHRKVLEVAAEAANYGGGLAPGRALGIAVQESFGSVAAQVAEVSIGDDGRAVVHKVTCAMDCGWVVNPDTAEAQIESGIIYGLTAALYGAITIENGRVTQGNFPDYEMLRMATSPEIEVRLVESGAPLGGLGEPATPPVAAAVTNAIYILTGQRLRELPIGNRDFSAANSLAGSV